MRASAIGLIRRGIAGDFTTLTHPFSHFHSDLRCQGRRHISSMLRIDFSSVTNMHFASFLFREMMRIRPTPSVALFSNLLDVVVKMDQYTAALSMFDEMRQSGAPMNVCTMNIVINCYCLLNRVDLGFAMVGSLLKLGYEPDAVTFTTLIKRLCVDDKVIEAEQLFTKLLLHNLCDPDGFMITTLVTELCKGGYTSRACDILKKRSLKPPSVYAYSIAINSLCKDGMVEDALELVGIMIDKGIPPGVIMYNSILHGLCNAGRWKDVVRLSEEMINRKVSFNVITFNTLVNALCKEGEVKDARHVVEIMIRQGISPDIITYNTLIHGYCVQGKMNKAKEMFHSIVDDGLKPNMFTYNSLIKGYCKKGKVDEAWCIFLDVPRKGLQHSPFTYNTMIHGLFRDGKFSEGWKLFNHMEADQKVDPSLVTCNILLNGLLKDHQIEKAFSFLHMMEDRGVIPDIFTYVALVKGLCAGGRVGAARDILNLLPSKGLQPDAQIFTTIIASLCREGLTEEAKCLLEAMEGNGCTPSSVSVAYNSIIGALLSRNKLYEAMPLLEEMSERGFMVESSTLSMLLHHFHQRKKDEILRRMIREVVPEDKHVLLRCLK